MSLSPAAIGKLYVDLHTAQQDLAKENDRWESHLDFCTCAPPMSPAKQSRLFNKHQVRVWEITDRINACKAQIAAL